MWHNSFSPWLLYYHFIELKKKIFQIESRWAVDYQFVVEELQFSLIEDSFENSLPLSYVVNTKNEIMDMFGLSAYAKGGSLIRMIHYILGDEKFINGIRKYLKSK